VDQLTPYTGRPSYGRPVTPLRAVEPETALRVGELERATACDALAEHFAAGRLDPAELDDRLARAMAARSRDDLRALFADLGPRRTPAAAEPEPVGTVRPEPRSGSDLAPVLATVVVLSLLLAGGMLLVLGAYNPALFVAALVGGTATAVAGGCVTTLARATLRRR